MSSSVIADCAPDQVLRHLGQAGRVLPQLQVDAVPLPRGLWPVSGQVSACVAIVGYLYALEKALLS